MYWLILSLSLLLFWILLHLFRQNMIYWGSSRGERTMEMPAQEKFKTARVMDTHAITIDAPAETVWNYLLQLGQNRGGFYSYRWLENLVGCKMPKIEHIVPELQIKQLGDKVYLHPKAPPLTVTVLEKNKFLAMDGWYLALVAKNPQQTRLITRSYEWRDPQQKTKLVDLIFSGVFFDFAHFIMERKMLLTIKRLAEARPNPELSLLARASLAWFGLLALAFVNGTLRELVLKPLLNLENLIAHQLSCVTGVFLWSIFVYMIWDKLKIPDLKASVQVGLGWLITTALFETFILNRSLSWTEILHTYNFMQGEFWGLALLWIGLMPAAIYIVVNDKQELRAV